MAKETYYFFFSLILVLLALFCVVNLIYLRLKGKTTFGLKLKRGSPEYNRVMKLATNNKIAAVVLMLLIFIANFTYTMVRITRLDREDAIFYWVATPIFVIIFFVGSIVIGRKQVKLYGLQKHD